MSSTIPQNATAQARIVDDAGAVGTWQLDRAGSDIAFDVKKFWGLATVHGAFGSLDGSAAVAPDGAISGALVIETASVDTGQPKRDEHLRGADFFDVERHPALRVAVDRVDLIGPSSGTATGTVTILDVTRPVSFDVNVAHDAQRGTALVSGGVTLDRSAFGMTWSPLRMAAFDVVVSFRLEFRADAA